MSNKRKIFSVFQRASAIFMILALVWLTISTPFVFASQQSSVLNESNPGNTQSPISDNDTDEDASSPFSNTTEEKNSTSTSFSEELLHEHHFTNYSFFLARQYHNCVNEDTYVAYHGELLVPPPNAV